MQERLQDQGSFHVGRMRAGCQRDCGEGQVKMTRQEKREWDESNRFLHWLAHHYNHVWDYPRSTSDKLKLAGWEIEDAYVTWLSRQANQAVVNAVLGGYRDVC